MKPSSKEPIHVVVRVRRGIFFSVIWLERNVTEPSKNCLEILGDKSISIEDIETKNQKNILYIY